MYANTTAVVLFGITGLFVALVFGALVTGTAFSLGGHGSRFRLVRMTAEPGMYWATIGMHTAFLVFMIWMDVSRLAPHAA